MNKLQDCSKIESLCSSRRGKPRVVDSFFFFFLSFNRSWDTREYIYAEHRRVKIVWNSNDRNRLIVDSYATNSFNDLRHSFRDYRGRLSIIIASVPSIESRAFSEIKDVRRKIGSASRVRMIFKWSSRDDFIYRLHSERVLAVSFVKCNFLSIHLET